MRGDILVIDDERYVFEDLEFGLGMAHNFHYAETLTKINHFLKNYPIDLAIVDLNFKLANEDRFSGLNYIKTLRKKYPTITIAVLSGYLTEERIVKATKNGADHFLVKGNFDTNSNDFREKIKNWINTKKRLDEKRELAQWHTWGVAVQNEDEVNQILEYNLKKQSFFFMAEPGLGQLQFLKYAYRKSVHFKSGKEPIIVDLSTYRPKKLESFLFLEKGTTAKNFLKNSPVSQLFIRNITHQPLSIQELFLRLLTTRKFLNEKEVFSQQLVFLIEKNPQQFIEDHSLSPELFNFLPQLELKPLRERKGELLSIMQEWQKRNGCETIKFSKEALILLRRYPYPGNISELYSILQNVLESHQKRFPLDWESEAIRAESLPNLLHQTPSNLHDEMYFEVAKVHLRFIETALQKYQGQRRQKDLAAKDLDIHSADNLKKTFIDKYWKRYPNLVKGFPTIMEKYKLNAKKH